MSKHLDNSVNQEKKAQNQEWKENYFEVLKYALNTFVFILLHNVLNQITQEI